MAQASSTKKKQVNERCWVLVGARQGPFWHARRVRPTTGAPATVSFDATWVTRREESHGDVIGFYHTHPSGEPHPSKRDERTMRAWTSSFGKALLCVIEAEGKVVAFRYDDDSSIAVRCTACERLSRGIVITYDGGT